MIFLEVSSIFAENFRSSLRVASNMLLIHCPYRFINVENAKDRAFLSSDFRCTFDSLFLEVACDLALGQDGKIDCI